MSTDEGAPLKGRWTTELVFRVLAAWADGSDPADGQELMRGTAEVLALGCGTVDPARLWRWLLLRARCEVEGDSSSFCRSGSWSRTSFYQKTTLLARRIAARLNGQSLPSSVKDTGNRQ